MESSTSQTDVDQAAETTTARGVYRDIIAGVVLLVIAAIFLLGAGEGTLDWVFPTTLAYATGAVGVILIGRAFLGGGGDKVSLIPSIFRGHGTDVAVFIAIMVVFVVAILPLGFWAASALMIFVAAAYLAPDRSRRNMAIAAGTAVAVVVLSYLLLEYVFYVPFPDVDWLPF